MIFPGRARLGEGEELEEEKGLRAKAEEVAYLVAQRAEEKVGNLEKQVFELQVAVKTSKEMGTSWVAERSRLLESIKSKDIALSVLGSELGQVKESSDREVESLWGVVNKLDSIECEKDSKIGQLRSERDGARAELARFVRETSGAREDLAAARSRAEHFQRVALTMKAAASKTREEASRYRRELAEIDKQLIEVAKNEGLELGVVGVGGLGGGGKGEKEGEENKAPKV